MFDTLFNLFKNDKMMNLQQVINIVGALMQHFEKNFSDDKNAKDAAIDTVIQILQSHKGK